jgi:hypothetical protein
MATSAKTGTTQTFDLEKFGIGTGLILAGGGGAMAMRRDREATKE